MDKIQQKEKKVTRVTCAYCGKIIEKQKTTYVPYGKTTRDKWIGILGKSFGKNLENNKNPSICRTHFEGGFQYNKQGQHPIRMKEKDDAIVQVEVPLIEETPSAICRVCSRETDLEVMTKIPSDTTNLLKWFKILGTTFYENINSTNSPHLICLVHLREMVDQLCKE